jgi:hypothetical protein
MGRRKLDKNIPKPEVADIGKISDHEKGVTDSPNKPTDKTIDQPRIAKQELPSEYPNKSFVLPPRQKVRVEKPKKKVQKKVPIKHSFTETEISSEEYEKIIKPKKTKKIKKTKKTKKTDMTYIKYGLYGAVGIAALYLLK